MNYEATGIVNHIGQVETVGAKGFKKRLLVIETDSKYDNLLPVEFKQDKCALLDVLDVGQQVTVSFSVGGREYNGRYFASISGWKVSAEGGAQKGSGSVTNYDDSPGFDEPF